jgi:transcriptional regulator with XRE-family HTH domain
MPISLGKAAQDLRARLNLSLRQAAMELGVSYVHLCNIENGKASPSPEMLEKFHDAWGIDLYMYALAFFPDERATPKSLKAPVKALAAGWKRHIEMLLRERSTEGTDSCLISAD